MEMPAYVLAKIMDSASKSINNLEYKVNILYRCYNAIAIVA